MENEELFNQARDILSRNCKNGYTIPGAGIYPFQWKWDSGFIALGYSHYDLKQAMTEMETLFRAQWSNGFVPHIVFHSESERDNYFPNAGFYQAQLAKEANKQYQTTTLTQPPVEGWVLEKIWQAGKYSNEMNTFVKKLFPKVLAQHQYLYSHRDPFHEGLVYIQHNWESGTDNSPVWDEIWNSFEVPAYHFSRKDTHVVAEDQRPLKKEYDYYLYLIDLFKKWQYDDKKIAQYSPFLVQDPLFNSMLIASNESLIRIAESMGFSHEAQQLERWNRQSIEAINTKLFDTKEGLYRHYDLRNKEWLSGNTSSGFAPLFAGAPSAGHVKQLVATIKRFSRNGKYFLVPSFDPDDPRFEAQRYWRGPVWVNMNWLIFKGLERYGETALAGQIYTDTLHMVREQGFFEYFEPDKAQSRRQGFGYGGKQFSWTAALIVDLLEKQTQ
jgi:hypothetical protein